MLLPDAPCYGNQTPEATGELPAERRLWQTQLAKSSEGLREGARPQCQPQDQLAWNCSTQPSEFHFHHIAPARPLPQSRNGSKKSDFGNGKRNQDQREETCNSGEAEA